jgi:hypothetical protein
MRLKRYESFVGGMPDDLTAFVERYDDADVTEGNPISIVVGFQDSFDLSSLKAVFSDFAALGEKYGIEWEQTKSGIIFDIHY